MSVGLLLLVGLMEITVGGSIYLNNPELLSDRDEVLGSTRGINNESSIKMVSDVSDTVSASIKICYGCHGFSPDQAHVDWKFSDAMGLRIGRFPVPFGEFYLRHDPANHRSASKPLPYQMGRMLRREEFNLTVVPEPYPDNGVELFGTLRGENVEFSYSGYVVAGFKGTAEGADLDFVLSGRRGPYADNNQTASVGGRAVLAFFGLPTAFWRWFALGASAHYGKYDKDDELYYAMGGLDLYMRLGEMNLRSEYVFRRTEVPDDQAMFRTKLKKNYTQREGYYIQMDGPLISSLEWLLRLDGFRRDGPLLTEAELVAEDTSITRMTGGVNILATSGVTLKLNLEYWHFDDYEDEVVLHTGMVGTF